MTDIGVATLTGKPRSADVTAQVAASVASVRISNRLPPTLTLSADINVIISTLGRRLNCITAIQRPPSAESMVRLRNSARRGSSLRRAIACATWGHTKPLATSSNHHAIGASCSARTEAPPMKPSASPSVRKRWMRRTKATSRSR
jgi:hypothetical protein